MTSTLPSIDVLKDEARILRRKKHARGVEISHSTALEHVAENYGYRDWNTLRAQAANHHVATYQLGDILAGQYLGKRFVGEITSVTSLPDTQFRVTFQFDEPVDVVEFDSFSNFRSRVTVVIDAGGQTQAKTSDGKPHMVLEL